MDTSYILSVLTALSASLIISEKNYSHLIFVPFFCLTRCKDFKKKKAILFSEHPFVPKNKKSSE
jgi:hypothetical protein